MSAKPSLPQKVLWVPSDKQGRPGIRVIEADGSEEFRPWEELKRELEDILIPQLFAAPPLGWTFVTNEHNGKKDWLVQIVDEKSVPYCNLWLGNNPDNGWGYDGFLRVGRADQGPPHVWQTYQRYSDGTYRRQPSRFRSIDKDRIQKGAEFEHAF